MGDGLRDCGARPSSLSTTSKSKFIFLPMTIVGSQALYARSFVVCATCSVVPPLPVAVAIAVVVCSCFVHRRRRAVVLARRTRYILSMIVAGGMAWPQPAHARAALTITPRTTYTACLRLTHSLVSKNKEGGDKGVPLEVPPHNTLNTSHSSQVGGWAHKTLKTNAEHSDTGRSGLLSGARRYGTISDHTKKTCK